MLEGENKGKVKKLVDGYLISNLEKFRVRDWKKKKKSRKEWLMIVMTGSGKTIRLKQLQEVLDAVKHRTL